MPRKKSIDEMRIDIEPELNPSVVTIPPEGEKPKRKYAKRVKEIEPDISAASIGVLLETPFTILRGITGYDGFKIEESIKPAIVESGLQVYKDFGFQFYGKYMNLAVFSLLYGGSILIPFSKYQKIQKAKKDKDLESDNINLGKAGEREILPVEKSNTPAVS